MDGWMELSNILLKNTYSKNVVYTVYMITNEKFQHIYLYRAENMLILNSLIIEVWG